MKHQAFSLPPIEQHDIVNPSAISKKAMAHKLTDLLVPKETQRINSASTLPKEVVNVINCKYKINKN